MKKDGRVTFGYRIYESIEEASKHLRVPVGMLYAKLSAIEKRKAALKHKAELDHWGFAYDLHLNDEEYIDLDHIKDSAGSWIKHNV